MPWVKALLQNMEAAKRSQGYPQMSIKKGGVVCGQCLLDSTHTKVFSSALALTSMLILYPYFGNYKCPYKIFFETTKSQFPV